MKPELLQHPRLLRLKSHDCFVWSFAASHQHSLPYLFSSFFFSFCGDLRLSFFTNREELVGSLFFFVSLVFSLFSRAVTVVRPFFHSSYCPELNFSPLPTHLAPPKPDISHQFVGIGSPHSALLHLMTCVYLVAIIPPPFCSEIYCLKKEQNDPHSRLSSSFTLIGPSAQSLFFSLSHKLLALPPSHYLLSSPPFSLALLPPPSPPSSSAALRWWVSASHRTALVPWAAPCSCVLWTQPSCRPTRLAS